MKALFIILPLLFGAVFTFLAIVAFSGNKKNLIQGTIYSILIGVCFFTLIIVPGSIHQVEAGQVAVVKVWGEAKEVRTAGIYYDFWLSRHYEIYDAKVQQVQMKTSAYSKDAQTMDIELVVQYQIQQDKAIDIAKVYGGLEMLENRIETVSIEKTKSVLSQKQAMSIIETRQTVSQDVESAIRNAITDEYFVNITTVVLTDISFSDAFEKTVEDKMIAEQEKLKAEYEKEKAIIQAEQALEVARKDAEAQIARAQAEAKSVELIATAQANSVKIKSVEIARMLGFTIIETTVEDNIRYDIDFTGKSVEEIQVISSYLKYIEYLETWDGTLPTTLVTDGTGASILVPIGD